jgi:hypothetical protein
VLSPTAILGYGFPVESLEQGLKLEPDVIAVDGGSTDPGPYYLGEGISFTSELGVKRDLKLLVKASDRLGIPLIIGTAGGSGARPHVEWTLRILKEVMDELGVKRRVITIWSDVEKEKLIDLLSKGREVRFAENEIKIPLTKESIENSVRIVAQMGLEPFIEALKRGADIIVAGRSVDVAPFASLPVLKGFDKGLAIHMGKILECGAIAADPGSGSDGMIGILRKNEFMIRPLNPKRRATRVSVAEHSLYERSDPYREYVPGGYVDLSSATYEEEDEYVVVKGSRWVSLDKYMVKLEGVRFSGYRTIFIAGARDPDFISRFRELFNIAKENVKGIIRDEFKVFVRLYGKNGVMGDREPLNVTPHEIGIVVEIIANSPEKSKAIASLLRSSLLHIGWKGRKTTAGNLAFPFSPSDIFLGRAYEWSVWHLIELKEPLELFKIEEVKLP